MTSDQGRENRERGHRFEIRVMNQIKRDAKYVMHSAGSYGLFDLIALAWDGRVRLITCKANGYLSPSERKALRSYMNVKQNSNEVIELYYYKNKRTIGRTIITKEVLK